MSIGLIGPVFVFLVAAFFYDFAIASAKVASSAPYKSAINFFAFVVLDEAVAFFTFGLLVSVVELNSASCSLAAFLGGLPLFLFTGAGSDSSLFSSSFLVVANERIGPGPTRKLFYDG